jgi:hypothetical protein
MIQKGNDYYYDDNDDDEMRFIEVWDYVGGTCFRGFIADKKLPRARVEKTLFLFFESVGGTQLKPGYVAHAHAHAHAAKLLISWKTLC